MLLKGLLIGVFVSAPVGPIGVLCVQRTLNGGKWHGIFTSLGAICSDLLYAIIAIFSMSIVIDFIESHQLLLQIVGTLIVFIMLGACFWWTFLVVIVNYFRGRINLRGLYVVNRAAGIALMVIAIIGGFAFWL